MSYGEKARNLGLIALMAVFISEQALAKESSGSRSLETRERRALLVGLNKYSPDYGVTPLNFCVLDAEGVRDTLLLGDPAGRWRSANMTMLTDRKATRKAIRKALSQMAAESSAGDLVLYYHSGHGGQYHKTDTFLCAYDADYPDFELAEDLAKFDADVYVVIVIDACHSGGMFKHIRGDRTWRFAEQVMTAYRSIRATEFMSRGESVPKTLGDNIAFMTASDYNEYSYESAPHGVFTGFLIRGSRIVAVDSNNDGEYQFLELFSYARENALESGYKQHAQSLNDELLKVIAARACGVFLDGVHRDFDGDGKADLVLYHEDSGILELQSSRWRVQVEENFNLPGFRQVLGDFDGNGVSDPAFYHEESGLWYVFLSGSGYKQETLGGLGGPGWEPVAADFDGDGRVDPAVYNEGSGEWVALLSGSGYAPATLDLGGPGWRPVQGDYNGDGRVDPAVFNAETRSWRIFSQ